MRIEAQFGKKPNFSLNVVCTIPNLSNLSYEDTIKIYLDEDNGLCN